MLDETPSERRRTMTATARVLVLGLITGLACDADRLPDSTVPGAGADPIDRNASTEDLYFELVRLHSLGLVSAERMDALQIALDDLELGEDNDRERSRREVIASILRRTLGELAKSDPELAEGMEARDYARRLHRRGVVVSQDLGEVTLVVAGLLGVPTSKGELVLVAALPVGGYMVAKVANVALKRALLLLRKAKSIDDLILGSERLGLQLRFARGSPELASTISGKPIDEALFARIKAAFERQGGAIDQGPDIDRFLEMRGLEAVTYNEKLVLCKSRPCTSDVFEELIHTAQHRSGRWNNLADQVGTAEATRVMEIEAAEKLIRNAKAWGIPDEETRQTAERLAKLREGGGH